MTGGCARQGGAERSYFKRLRSLHPPVRCRAMSIERVASCGVVRVKRCPDREICSTLEGSERGSFSLLQRCIVGCPIPANTELFGFLTTEDGAIGRCRQRR